MPKVTTPQTCRASPFDDAGRQLDVDALMLGTRQRRVEQTSYDQDHRAWSRAVKVARDLGTCVALPPVLVDRAVKRDDLSGGTGCADCTPESTASTDDINHAAMSLRQASICPSVNAFADSGAA